MATTATTADVRDQCERIALRYELLVAGRVLEDKLLTGCYPFDITNGHGKVSGPVEVGAPTDDADAAAGRVRQPSGSRRGADCLGLRTRRGGR